MRPDGARAGLGGLGCPALRALISRADPLARHPPGERAGLGYVDSWLPLGSDAAAVVAWFEAQIVAVPPLHFRSEPSAHSISLAEPEV